MNTKNSRFIFAEPRGNSNQCHIVFCLGLVRIIESARGISSFCPSHRGLQWRKDRMVPEIDFSVAGLNFIVKTCRIFRGASDSLIQYKIFKWFPKLDLRTLKGGTNGSRNKVLHWKKNLMIPKVRHTLKRESTASRNTILLWRRKKNGSWNAVVAFKIKF